MCFALTLRELISVCHGLAAGLWSSPTCEWGQLLQVSSQWLINIPVIVKRSEEIDIFCDAIVFIILISGDGCHGHHPVAINDLHDPLYTGRLMLDEPS